MTIELGWWLLPLGLTILSYARATWVFFDDYDGHGGYFGAAADTVAFAFYYGAATIFSLLAWLIYFALT